MDTATQLLVNHNLDPNEWEHYLTSMSDDGDSVFCYDNAAGDTLRIYPKGSRHEIKRAAPPCSTEEAIELAAERRFTPPPASTESVIERIARDEIERGYPSKPGSTA